MKKFKLKNEVSNKLNDLILYSNVSIKYSASRIVIKSEDGGLWWHLIDNNIYKKFKK